MDTDASSPEISEVDPEITEWLRQNESAQGALGSFAVVSRYYAQFPI
jgi:hypothetical protein